MSSYITLELSYYTFSNLIDFLEKVVQNTDNISELYDLVHLIDFLEEEKMRSEGRHSKETKRWFEQERLFRQEDVEKDPQMVFLFSKISGVFDRYYEDELLPEMTPQDEFHLIYDIMDAIKKHEGE